MPAIDLITELPSRSHFEASIHACTFHVAVRWFRFFYFISIVINVMHPDTRHACIPPGSSIAAAAASVCIHAPYIMHVLMTAAAFQMTGGKLQRTSLVPTHCNLAPRNTDKQATNSSEIVDSELLD